MIRITSPNFYTEQYIPPEFTCDGKNSNPALDIHDVPRRTVSLALVFDMLELGRGREVHWIVWNIPPDVSHIDAASYPEGAFEGMNDFGVLGYSGPCPKDGKRHYVFTVYAVDKMFTPPGAVISIDELEHAMVGHVVDSGRLTGYYGG